MRNRLRELWAGLVIVVWAAPGAAQQAAPPPPPPPAATAAAPPSAATGSSPRQHDGFYLRFGLGGGVAQDSYSVDVLGASAGKGTIKGGGALFEAFIGGTVGKHWVLGGGVIEVSLVSPKDEFDGVTRPTGDTTYSLGAGVFYASYYFDPSDGWYLQGYTGFGVGSVKQTSTGESKTDDYGAVGGVVGFGGGWETFVGDEWSLGVGAGLTYAQLTGNYILGDVHHTVTYPHAALTLTYH